MNNEMFPQQSQTVPPRINFPTPLSSEVPNEIGYKIIAEFERDDRGEVICCNLAVWDNQGNPVTNLTKQFYTTTSYTIHVGWNNCYLLAINLEKGTIALTNPEN